MTPAQSGSVWLRPRRQPLSSEEVKGNSWCRFYDRELCVSPLTRATVTGSAASRSQLFPSIPLLHGLSSVFHCLQSVRHASFAAVFLGRYLRLKMVPLRHALDHLPHKPLEAFRALDEWVLLLIVVVAIL